MKSSIRNIGILLLATAALSACGPQKKRKDLICRTGVNAETCSSQITEKSTWVSEIPRLDPVTQKPLDDGSHWKVILQFFPPEKNAAGAASVGTFRKILTLIEPEMTPRSTIVEGEILALDQGNIKVNVKQSSCDTIHTGLIIKPGDVSIGRDLSVTRAGAQLSINEKPSVVITEGGGGLGGLFGRIITRSVVLAGSEIAKGVGQSIAKSFGLDQFYVDELQGVEGDYQFTQVKDLTYTGFAIGQVGCFKKNMEFTAIPARPTL